MYYQNILGFKSGEFAIEALFPVALMLNIPFR